MTISLYPQDSILLDAFIEAEKLDFNSNKNEFLDRTKKQILEWIKSWNGGYIELISLSNVGLISRSIKIDGFRMNNNSSISAEIILCSCGTNWSAKNNSGKILHLTECHIPI